VEIACRLAGDAREIAVIGPLTSLTMTRDTTLHTCLNGIELIERRKRISLLGRCSSEGKRDENQEQQDVGGATSRCGPVLFEVLERWSDQCGGLLSALRPTQSAQC